jgi:hypothetical protein
MLLEITVPVDLPFREGRTVFLPGNAGCLEGKHVFPAGNVLRAAGILVFLPGIVFCLERNPVFLAGKVVCKEGKEK